MKCDYRRVFDWWPNLLDTWYSARLHFAFHCYVTVVSTVTSSSLPLLGSDSNDGRSSSSGFPNCHFATAHNDWAQAIFFLTTTEFESYVTTDGQSASLSWNKAPIWDLRPDLHYCQSRVFLMWGCLSDESLCLSFTIAADPRQRSHSWVPVPWDLRPFRRLLRLAGLRWTPPPQGIDYSC
jgi:hypothetical protein